MDPIKYHDGQLVKIGDSVEVSSLFGRKKSGKVIYVYDPNEPSGPNGKNDYGVSIRLEKGKELWGLPEKNTKLLGRS